MWRNTKYKKEYVDAADTFLQECEDSYEEFHKTRGSSSDTFERNLTVNLPTLYKFANYLGVNNSTLYERESKHPIFSNALDKIREAQKQRLLDKWLSWEYNSTIAKLILSANHWMSETEKREIKANINVSNLSDEELLDLIK